VIGDDADLVVAEPVALGEQLHDVKHRLRRGVHGELVAVEAGDGGMRLEAAVRLRAGAESLLDQPRILLLARRRDPTPRFFAFCENADDGPRTLPCQAAGAGVPSETLPARLRLAFSNTTGESGWRAASSPITEGSRSLVIRIAAMAASAVLRSLAATRRWDRRQSAPCGRRRAAILPRARRPSRGRRQIEPGDAGRAPLESAG